MFTLANIVITATVVVALLAVIRMVNNLILKRNEVQNAFGTVDAQLKQRHDQIPNLVSAVQTYMGHEAGTMKMVTELRTRALNPGIGQDERVEIENKITSTLGNIMIAVEQYPDLKASQSFLHLQGSLNQNEEMISAARRGYNEAVTAYNNAVETIPGNIFALLMGYKRKPVLETPEHERQNVNVKQVFGSNS